MCWIVARAKCGEVPLQEQGAETDQAALIRRRHDDPTAGPGDPRQLPHERARILEMLNRLDRYRHVRGTIRKRNWIAIQIRAHESYSVRQAVISNGVDAHIRFHGAAEKLAQPARSASDVDYAAAGASLAQR